MVAGITKKLFEFTGKVGKCDKGHVVKIQESGFGFCDECSTDGVLNHTLWIPPDHAMKVEEIK